MGQVDVDQFPINFQVLVNDFMLRPNVPTHEVNPSQLLCIVPRLAVSLPTPCPMPKDNLL